MPKNASAPVQPRRAAASPTATSAGTGVLSVEQVVAQLFTEYLAWGQTVWNNSNNYQRVEHVITALFAVWVLLYLWGIVVKTLAALTTPRRTLETVAGMTIRFFKKLPFVSGQVAKEQEKILKLMGEVLTAKDASLMKVVNTEIPKKGIPGNKLLEIMKSYRGVEDEFSSNKAFGGIYGRHDKLAQVGDQAYCMYADSNALYPMLFPAIKKFEAEVTRMACTMMHGDANTCGTMTLGGTESIVMAVKSYRDRARAEFGITKPNLVMPASAHAAFDKACHFFNIELIKVDVGSDYRADVAKMKRAVNSNTILMVGSAPGFPHGLIDDLETLSEFASSKGIPFHVDACFGGFLLPWYYRRGYIKKKFDFLLPGVTSISADIHKFGFGPKGNSLIMYRSFDYLKYQFFTATDWSGGLYASPSFAGSRPGGLIAGAWATLCGMGQDGYFEHADAMWEGYQAVIQGIRDIDGLEIIGDEPDAGIVAYTSKTFSIFQVADEMGKLGWEVDRLQRPACVHLSFGMRQCDNYNEYISDLADCVERVKAAPEQANDGMAPIYGMAASVPDRSIVNDILVNYMRLIYVLPEGENTEDNGAEQEEEEEEEVPAKKKAKTPAKPRGRTVKPASAKKKAASPSRSPSPVGRRTRNALRSRGKK